MITRSITTLLPVHKSTKYIDFIKSINSITYNQSFVPKEIIILIDGPTDQRIPEYIKHLNKSFQFSKFIVIKFALNRGLGVVLNAGIMRAKYDLILRCDSDDISLKDRVKNLYNIYLKNKNISLIDSAMLEQIGKKNYIRYFDKNKKNILIFSKIRNLINHPSVLIKKKDVIKAGNYKHLPFFEDYYLWVRMLKLGCRFYGTSQILVKTTVEPSFYARRTGRKYLHYYSHFLSRCLKIGFINKFELNILYFLRYFIILSNKKFISFFYRVFLRK
jgi:glycosyltransferase involved in cell wall biosynthesis